MASHKKSLQRTHSSEHLRPLVPPPFRPATGRKAASPNVRAYGQFVRDTFAVSRAPLFQPPNYYERCPLAYDPEPRGAFDPPMNYEPLVPSGTFGPKPKLETQIDYDTFRPRPLRSRDASGDTRRQRHGDYNPMHTRRPEPIDKIRGDRDLERRIEQGRSWQQRGVAIPSVYPTSWEKAYMYEPSRYQSLHKLMPNSSVDCYSFSNPRAHKAALMAATMRTSPDFWKYTFPHEYLPSWRLAHLEYYFTHGYPHEKPIVMGDDRDA